MPTLQVCAQPGVKGVSPPGQRQAVPRSDAFAAERVLLREDICGRHKARRTPVAAPAPGLTLARLSADLDQASNGLDFCLGRVGLGVSNGFSFENGPVSLFDQHRETSSNASVLPARSASYTELFGKMN